MNRCESTCKKIQSIKFSVTNLKKYSSLNLFYQFSDPYSVFTKFDKKLIDDNLYWSYHTDIKFIRGQWSRFWNTAYIIVFSICQYFCIACYMIILMNKWDKFAKFYWLTNKILTLIIVVLPKNVSLGNKTEKFSLNFLFWCQSLLVRAKFHNILKISNIDNNLFYKYLFVFFRHLAEFFFKTIRILQFKPRVNNLLPFCWYTN